MFYPTLFGDDLFDDFMGFDFPRFRDGNNIEHKLYGKHASGLMKTDVHDNDGNYELDIDLPGFKKEEINIEVNEGYLTISAAKGVDKDQKDEKGNILHQERYTGSISRSFYIGEEVSPEEVHAKFEDGVLHLNIPKKEEKTPERNTIMIE